jgi:hypothetical protein
MQIEVLGVGVENKGKYRVAKVDFKNTETGKIDGKQIMSFTYKDVFKTMSEAKQGDIFDVKAVKNDKGYWDWVEATTAGKNTGAEAPKAGATKAAYPSRDFETSEERAKKQVYIVRQSSISAAIELLGFHRDGGPVTEEDVINTAKKFEAYVFDVQLPEVDVK